MQVGENKIQGHRRQAWKDETEDFGKSVERREERSWVAGVEEKGRTIITIHCRACSLDDALIEDIHAAQ